MTLRRILILWTCLAFGPFGVHANEPTCESLQIGGPPEYFPLSYLDRGDLKGVGIDLARLAAREANLPATISYKGSWARVLQQHALGRLDIVVGLYHTEAREETMIFLPAFWKEDTNIVMRRDNPIDFTEWNDLKAYKGVTIASDSRGDNFDAFMRNELDMLYVHSQEVAFNLLKAGRVDYMLTGQYSMFNADDFATNAPLALHPTPIDNHKIYMAFARRSPCANLAERFARALEKLIKEDRVAPLFVNHPTATGAATAH